MEKIEVRDELKNAYLNLVRSAQQMEGSIGAAEYRIFKMKNQRQQIDVDLKSWWDSVADEYKLDKTKDFYVDNDGAINQVERPPEAGDKPEQPIVEEIKDPDVGSPQPEEAPKDDKAGGTAADLT